MGTRNLSRLSHFACTTGRQCELLSPCVPNPCEHGGHCESATGQLVVCSCPSGWQGTPAVSFSSPPSSPLYPAPLGDAGDPERDSPLTLPFRGVSFWERTELNSCSPCGQFRRKGRGMGLGKLGFRLIVWSQLPGGADLNYRMHSAPNETRRRPFWNSMCKMPRGRLSLLSPISAFGCLLSTRFP